MASLKSEEFLFAFLFMDSQRNGPNKNGICDLRSLIEEIRRLNKPNLRGCYASQRDSISSFSACSDSDGRAGSGSSWYKTADDLFG